MPCKPKLRDRLQVALLAGVAWLPISFVRTGYAWDDWVSAILTADQRAEWTQELARFAPISTHILNAFGPPGVRFAVSLALAVTGIAVYEIFDRMSVFSSRELRFLAVFTAVNPLDTSKSLLSTSTYSISLALFYVAWWLINNRRLWPLALPLFFVAFNTGSLALFALLPFTMLLVGTTKNRDFRGLLPLVGLIMTVLSFGAFRFLLRPAGGTYSGYNVPALWSLVLAFCLLLLVFTFGFLCYKNNKLVFFADHHVSLILAAGVFSSTTGLLPYLAVGKYPPFVSMLSRHSLLLGLGAALLVIFFVRFSSRSQKVREHVMKAGLILTISVTWFHCFLFYHYLDFVEEVSGRVAEIKIPSNALVVVSYERDGWARLSETVGPNFANSFYVWNGLVSMAQGSRSDIFAIHDSDFGFYFQGRYEPAYGPGVDRFGSEMFMPSTSAILLQIRRLGSEWSLMPDYSLSARVVTIPLPGA